MTNTNLSRRSLLARAVLLGASVPAAALVAACGGDDDEPTATTTSQATGTSGTGEATATTAGEPTPTVGVNSSATMPAEATPTERMTEPSPTTEAAEPTATEMAEVTEIYGFPIEPAQHEGGTLVRGVQFLFSDFAGWHLAGYSLRGIFEGLNGLHPETGEPVPLLAEGWEVSDDARVWTFSLRQGVTFHNGEPLRAEDVVFSTQLDNVAFVGSAPITEAIVMAQDETVVYEFPEPAANILFALYYYRVRSQQFFADIEPATVDWEMIRSSYEGTIVDPALVNGTGPFRFAGGESGVSETVTRFERYWGGAPHLDEIIFQQFASVDLYLAALQTGGIDMAGDQFSAINPAQAGGLDPDAFTVTSYNLEQALTFNPNHSPDRLWFQDVRVRQALLYAIDREALIDPLTVGFGEVANTPITASWAYDPDEITVRYDYDLAKANALLDEAGWVLGGDGVREKDGQRFSFVANYRSGDSSLETLGVILQEQWREIGVECALEGLDSSVYVDKLIEFDYDLMVDTAPTEYAALWYVYSCESPSYAADAWAYCNPDLQAVLDEAGTTVDLEQQRALVTEAANIILEDVPVGLLVTRPGLVAVSNRVHNVYPNVYDLMFNAHTWWMDE
jgi:peptide/nickel transport system substrate-binding protein